MPSQSTPKSIVTLPVSPKPYCNVGAGDLSSFVWKEGDVDSGWRYCFNIFRVASRRGRVTQAFRPSDLCNLVKLTQVLASVIADDGCLPPAERQRLARLASALDDCLTYHHAPQSQPDTEFPDGNKARS